MFSFLFVALLFVTLVGCVKVPEPSAKEGRFDFSVTY